MSSKAWTTTEFNDVYASLLGAHLLATVRETWATAPSLVRLKVTGARRGPNGAEERLFTVNVTKALGAAAIVEDGGRKTTFTHLLDAADLADLRGVEVSAHQFRRWVPKAYEARVTVVGDQVFTAAIHAGSAAGYLDWRNDYRALQYERIDPPGEVVAGVLEYCVELGLLYGAFDFVIRPDGAWVFLECNATGQYGWIEDAVNAPITDAIADLLAKGAA